MVFKKLRFRRRLAFLLLALYFGTYFAFSRIGFAEAD